MNTIEELLTLRNELMANTEILQAKILEFEEELNKLGIGLACWIKADETLRVGYFRFRTGWHLAAEVTNEDGIKNIKPLTQSSRGARLYGYKHRDELLQELLETARKFNTKMIRTLNDEKEVD